MNDRYLLKDEIAKNLGLSTATFFERLDYWLERSPHIINGQKWIYNTFNTWHEQLSGMSVSTIRRAIKKLVEIGLVVTEKKRASKGDHSLWYSINEEKRQTMLKTLQEKCKRKTAPSPTKKNNYDYIILNKKNCSKRTNGNVQNEQIIYIDTNTNTTNINSTSSSSELEKTDRKEESPIFQFSEEDISKIESIWKKVFCKSNLPFPFTQTFQNYLARVWGTHFESSFEQWEFFCTKICSSQFLMGEKENTSFKANLRWLLRVETIERIFADDFDIGDRIPDQQQIALKHKAELQAKEKIQAYIQKKSEEEIETQKRKRSWDHYKKGSELYEKMSPEEKINCKEKFKSSAYYKKELQEYQKNMQQTPLGKLAIEKNPFPCPVIEKHWLMNFLKKQSEHRTGKTHISFSF